MSSSSSSSSSDLTQMAAASTNSGAAAGQVTVPLAPAGAYVFVNGVYTSTPHPSLSQLGSRPDDALSRSFFLTLHGYEVTAALQRKSRFDDGVLLRPEVLQKAFQSLDVLPPAEQSKLRWMEFPSQKLAILCFDSPQTANTVLERFHTEHHSNRHRIGLQLDHCLPRGGLSRAAPDARFDEGAAAASRSSSSRSIHDAPHVKCAAPEQFLAQLQIATGEFEYFPEPIKRWCQEEHLIRKRFVLDSTPIEAPTIINPDHVKMYLTRVVGRLREKGLHQHLTWIGIEPDGRIIMQVQSDISQNSFFAALRGIDMPCTSMMGDLAKRLPASTLKFCREHFGGQMHGDGSWKPCRFGVGCHWSHDSQAYMRALEEAMSRDGVRLEPSPSIPRAESPVRYRRDGERNRSRSREREWNNNRDRNQMPSRPMYAHPREYPNGAGRQSYTEPPPMESLDRMSGVISLPEEHFHEAEKSAASSNSVELLHRLIYTDDHTPSGMELSTPAGRELDLRRVLDSFRHRGADLTDLRWIARRWTKEGMPTNEILLQLRNGASFKSFRMCFNRGNDRPALDWIESFLRRTQEVRPGVKVCFHHWRLSQKFGQLVSDCARGSACRASHESHDLIELFRRVREIEGNHTEPAAQASQQAASSSAPQPLAQPVVNTSAPLVLEDIYADDEENTKEIVLAPAAEEIVPFPHKPCYSLHSVTFTPDLDLEKCLMVDEAPQRPFPADVSIQLLQSVKTGRLFKKEYRDEWTKTGLLSRDTRWFDILHCALEFIQCGILRPEMQLQNAYRDGNAEHPEQSVMQLQFSTQAGRDLFAQMWNQQKQKAQ